MTDNNEYWGLALEGPDPEAALRWFVAHAWAGRVPEQWVVDYQDRRPAADWLERTAANAKGVVAAYFTADQSESLIRYPSGLVAGRFPFTPDPGAALELLERAPFEVASFASLYPEWASTSTKYRRPSFGRNHYPHGWGCAFKGAGHERLVSRRWLQYGPWRLLQGAADVSLVQFHALDVPAKAAWSQARPGYRTMGIDEEGGFLQIPYVFETALAGLYDAGEQMLRMVVLGREPKPVELLDARAALKQGALADGKPLKRLAYVFPKPEDARRHLHALWLRELECWTVVDGVEQRLDTDYRPTPTPPDWVA
ncbi:hypothetical protein [Pseudoxanthomonas suwonensis]|uniref:Uncharacterized protein n=1 Tax=Pseudoxanthomonas suwonensis TaxID=314722 RepID=A0A0E3UNB0_9GAMM|nr:hypothetical protein [Pseudoxanthomonas suwonensis]AKC86795.1 hypothetical protein WQ53_08525 [Pseudoxanthomonas suwonensis]